MTIRNSTYYSFSWRRRMGSSNYIIARGYAAPESWARQPAYARIGLRGRKALGNIFHANRRSVSKLNPMHGRNEGTHREGQGKTCICNHGVSRGPLTVTAKHFPRCELESSCGDDAKRATDLSFFFPDRCDMAALLTSV